MKNQFHLLVFALLFLFSTQGFAQSYQAVNDTLCINEGDPIDLNVFWNDFLEDPTTTVMLEASSSTECFYIDQEGYIQLVPDAQGSCCGDHVLFYTACPGDGLACDGAEVFITVKCGKPDCTLINLEDYAAEDIGQNPGEDNCISVCAYSETTIFVPWVTSNTYVWNPFVPGGSWLPGSNPAEIVVTWGPSGAANITLDVTPPGGPTQTISVCVDVQLSPTANFTSPGYTCLNSPISFTNLSLNADDYHWDFGDGNYSSLEHPTHTYSSPGTYTVVLCATKYNYDSEGNPLCCCTDCIEFDVEVDDLPGPGIFWVSTLCQGDSSKYWTDATNCSTYNWGVFDDTGAAISFVGQGTDTICVTWTNGNFGTITLDVDGCDSLYCDNPSSVNVPIIPNNTLVNGPIEVCEYSSHLYSVPKWMSTSYNWTVLDQFGSPVPFDGQGGHQITVHWGPAGTGTVARRSLVSL